MLPKRFAPGHLFVLTLALYSQLVSGSGLSVLPILDLELTTLSLHLAAADLNRAQPGDIRIYLQGNAEKIPGEDNAAEKLFTHVNEAILEKDTYKKLIALFDNYDPDLSDEHRDSAQDDKEIEEFLDAIMKTPIMVQLCAFFWAKGHPYARTFDEFRSQFRRLWFTRYPGSDEAKENGLPTTRAFESAYIGEVNGERIQGVNNWVRYYLLERRGDAIINYRGYHDHIEESLVSIAYTPLGDGSNDASFFVGTSPEYELAMYTLCFLARRGEQCEILVNGCLVTVVGDGWSQGEEVYLERIDLIIERGEDGGCKRL